jgi:ATP-dependent DNA helicase RecG
MSIWMKPVTELKGVGPAVADKLLKLKVVTVQDLLFHFPLRYEDRSRVSKLQNVNIGDKVILVVTVQNTQVAFGKRRQLLITAFDDLEEITLRLFHFSKSQQSQFQPYTRVQLFGEVRMGRDGFEMVHPEYKILKPMQSPTIQSRYVPIYPITEGLQQKSLGKIIQQALNLLEQESVASLYSGVEDISISDAIRTMHNPPVETPLSLFETRQHPAFKRLIAEEILSYQISMLQLKRQQKRQTGQAFYTTGVLKNKLLAELPFKLTSAQEKVLVEIEQDIASASPMNRLVQGDVGSGKTLVAALAGLPVIEAGFQVALMAPTEILAEQHFNNFKDYYLSLGIQVKLIVGKQTQKQKKDAYELIAQSEVQMIIGTHAIFQEQVQFHRLGLIIIDEQHRFGVEQRKALLEKGKSIVPHQLVMTATPIPRTLAMTFYADLDLSVIDELPPGRKPIQTVVLPNEKRDKVVERVSVACKSGRQAYWVCTLIEESETLQCQAAEVTAEKLQLELPHLSIGLVHGKMRPQDKQLEMESFKNGDIDLLVATTVIEVGVDVPNASLMIIENPERLGLSQLHQLRGRVGRGSIDSHCVLMYQAPLSLNGQNRLAVMRDSNDGFVIADEDLKLRGPGEVLGTKQTGDARFKIADLQKDHEWIKPMHLLAQKMIIEAPDKAEQLVARWLGLKAEFARV